MFVNLPGSNPALGAGSKAVNVRSLGANGSPRRGRRTQRAPSVTEHAIDKIRERIVSGAWGAGDRLPKESELAGELGRSEEHTSELQSPDHLVCRLLLEKKKKNNNITNHIVTDKA